MFCQEPVKGGQFLTCPQRPLPAEEGEMLTGSNY